jgi:hypothetical protein
MADVVVKVAQKRGLFVQGVFSEADGTPSSTRILMFLFSLFSMGVIGSVVHHMILVKDAAILAIWITAFPGIVTVLIGLIVTPYTINKGAATMGDIFNALSGARRQGPSQ